MLYEPIKTSSTLSKLGTLQFNFVVHICIFFQDNSKKVAFNIASEASYVYILSGQKLI